jgi:uncharacterized protein
LPLETSLPIIAAAEVEREDENFRFRLFLKEQEEAILDAKVIALNNTIAPQINCTDCGNCCTTLMINVTEPECASMGTFLNQSVAAFKEQYIETSAEGTMMIMNRIPCAFLKGKKCTVYENRFAECREFPHLHKEGFRQRIFGTLMHYGRCPIIYNVIEQLKIDLDFKDQITI